MITSNWYDLNSISIKALASWQNLTFEDIPDLDPPSLHLNSEKDTLQVFFKNASAGNLLEGMNVLPLPVGGYLDGVIRFSGLLGLSHIPHILHRIWQR